MIESIQSYVRQSSHTVRRWAAEPRVRQGLRWSGEVLCGFVLSAASLANQPQPIALGLVCAAAGGQALRLGLGGCVGYLVFWGNAGVQGVWWLLLGMGAALLLGDGKLIRQTPLLLSAVAALIVSATGLAFQLWRGDEAPVSIYLLRIGLGAATVRVFTLVLQRRDPIADWMAGGLAVLALAQVAPVPWLSLGFPAAGALMTVGAFPGAALAGLGLDLAGISQTPMTAVACLTWLVRLVPGKKKWLRYAAPGLVYAVVMGLCGVWDPTPLPGLILGGLAGLAVPDRAGAEVRRGETGIAQVRLEMAAGVFAQMEQLLLEAPEVPVDEEALIFRAAERGCGSCPCRKTCRDREAALRMPTQLLHRPLLDAQDIPVSCRKPGRLLQELHRSQEQLRSIRGDRERQREYRGAVLQQYRFLAEYLQDLSDALGRRTGEGQVRFQPEVAFAANRREPDNGDRCERFAGVGCKYYVMLCDGMGTGLGAVDEGNAAADMLKKLLCAGYPAEYALRSLNSLCALRGKAGAVTVDLAELQLDCGKVLLYKWGAAPSWLVTSLGVEKIGTAGPPPGLSVTDQRETVERLSLRRGEMLVLLSDGAGGEETLRRCRLTPGCPPGEAAERILECADTKGKDDATAAAIRLCTRASA